MHITRSHLQLRLRLSHARAPDEVKVLGGEGIFHAAQESQQLGGSTDDFSVDAVSEDLLHHLFKRTNKKNANGR